MPATRRCVVITYKTRANCNDINLQSNMFVYNSVLGQLIPIDFYISGEASFPVPLLFLMQIMYSLFYSINKYEVNHLSV